MPGQTLAEIASSIPCVIYQSRSGENGEFLFIADAIERLLGYTAKEWRSDPTLWARSIHPGDRDRVVNVEDERVERLLDGQYANDTYRMLHRDGSVVWVQDEATFRRTDAGRFWEGVFLDVTAIREYEAELRQREIELARAEGARESAEAIVLDMQRSLLLVDLPVIPGLELAAAYRPGAAGTEVGGDFYDVTELEDGRVLLSVGDVTGHGAAAAASMGQLRQAIRAYASDGHSPGDILERAEHLLRDHTARSATAFVGILDLDTGVMSYASAGHVPPVLLAPDGRPTTVESRGGLPLGTGDPKPRPESMIAIEPESLLVLLTDGLVEAPGLAIVDGYRELVALIGAGGRPPSAKQAVDRVLGAIDHANPNDDAALLAVAIHAEIGDELHLTVPADRERLATLRRTISRWLRESGASPSEEYEFTLACAEICANAVDHAYGPTDNSYELNMRRDGRRITVSVRDHGVWRPSRGTHRGRGIELARDLTDELTIDASPEGTLITLVRELGADQP